MDFLQLRYFHEVAQSEHVTNSAKKLHVAQPALTQAIHRLEQELGVTLIERAGRGIRLTACGKLLDERIEPILSALDAIPEELAQADRQQRNCVRLSIVSASGLAVNAIAAYRAAHPHIRFIITQEEQKRWDICIRTRMVHPSQNKPPEDTDHTHYYLERIGVAVPCEKALHHPLHLNDLAGEPFIYLSGTSTFRIICDRLCAERGFRPLIAFESDRLDVVKSMIGLGLGIGFWPERSWSTLKDSNARLIPLADKNFARILEIATAPRPLHDEAAAFYDFLVAFFRTQWQEPSPFVN